MLDTPAATLRLILAGVVYEYVAHHLGCKGKEVGTISETGSILLKKAQIQFVDQRCCLHHAGVALPSQVGSSNLSQMRIDERHQLLEGLSFALLPAHQQNCDVTVSRGHARCEGPFMRGLFLSKYGTTLGQYFAAVNRLGHDAMNDRAIFFSDP